MRLLVIPAASFLCLALCGCGGSSAPPPPPAGAQFTIASANWFIPLSNANPSPPAGPFAGGLLSQSGNTISGILHVTGSPCFDPVADALLVQGTVSGDPNAANALTLTTSPVRGQTLSVSATWNRNLDPGLPPPTSPPNPVRNLVGTWGLAGGSCASMENAGFHVSNFSGSWSGALVGPSWGGQLTAVLSQTGPDAQGFSQISGTFNVQGVPCFTRGTIASTTFAGDIAQMNVLMDSGELTGSAQSGSEFMAGASIATITFNFVVHGGSCDGQSATSVVRQ